MSMPLADALDPQDSLKPGADWQRESTSEAYGQELLLRADRTFAGKLVAKAAYRVRAIVGTPHIPIAEAAAQRAWDKLRQGGRPSVTELQALELVIRLMRPALLSRRGALEPLPSAPGTSTYDPRTVAGWDGFRDRVKPFLYSIGRLDRVTGSDRSVGTGFLVSRNLVLTNRHVVTDLSLGVEGLGAGQAEIAFNEEAGTPNPFLVRFAITGIAALHARLDLALLRVELPEDRPIPEFARDAPKPATEIAAIGYPFEDGRNPLFVKAIYGSDYGVKRASLGQVTGGSGSRFFHDCSTLGGNSGSPIFALETGRVVGVHYTGQFMYRNEAVTAPEVAQFIAQVRGTC